MALKLYSDTDIQNIADSIRAKNGTTDQYKVSQMAQAIADLPTSNELDEFLAGTATIVRSNATALKKSAIVPTGNGGVLPERIDLPECTNLDLGAITYSTYLGSTQYFTGLTYLNLPKVEAMGTQSLCGIHSAGLTEIKLPNLKTIYNASSISVQCFSDNTSIEVYDLGKSSIESFNLGSGKPFYGNNSLTAVVLRYGGVVNIGNTAVFHKTNSASLLASGLKIYVPSALLESYKTAPNWSTLFASYPNMFATIEGSMFDY